MTDLLLRQAGAAPFSWGGGMNLAAHGEVRARYLEVLRAADGGDTAPLMGFVRS
jgi:hypothetical protein